MVIETNDDGRDGRGLRVKTRKPTPNPWRGCQSVGTDKRCQSDDSSTTRNEHSPVEGQRLRGCRPGEAMVAHVERLEGRVATVAVVGCGRRQAPATTRRTLPTWVCRVACPAPYRRVPGCWPRDQDRQQALWGRGRVQEKHWAGHRVRRACCPSHMQSSLCHVSPRCKHRCVFCERTGNGKSSRGG